MGTVYRARDPALDRLVALKTISPAMLAEKESLLRFQREARAAARLQHPSIVTIYELGEEADGTFYIAMELLSGVDLHEAMVPAERLTREQKLQIVSEVCEGLDYAHKRGVVHRDVKPANIRVLERGGVKILDFGIARLGDSNLTQTGIVLGTPSYLAPELIVGGRVDHRADMWAVGVVLYELVTGQRPFQGPTFASLAYKIVHEPLPAIDATRLGLPPAIGDTLARALDKDPAKRFRDMAEMAAQIESARGRVPASDATLSAEAREAACRRHLGEARQFLAQNKLELALEMARRARALEPSRSDIVALLDEIDLRLRDSVRAPAPTLDLPLVPLTPSRPLVRPRSAAAFRELGTFGEPPATQAACLSPVRDLLATAGADGAVRLWDLPSRTRESTLRTEAHLRNGHDARALCVAFSADGTLLASGHVDGAVHLWDLTREEEVRVRLRHEALVGAVAFSPDGTTLASGGMDSNLKLWNLAAARAGDPRREMHRQPSGVSALAYAAGGSQILTGHPNRVLRLIDAATARLVATLRGPDAQVSAFCLAPDGRSMAVASHDRTIRVFDMETRAPLAVLGGFKRPVTGLCFFPEGELLATVCLDNAVQIWNLQQSATVATLWGRQEESLVGVALFGEADHLAVALADGRIRLWGPADR
jgi:eukaryotic-like serine/threonine-protein kinase